MNTKREQIADDTDNANGDERRPIPSCRRIRRVLPDHSNDVRGEHERQQQNHGSGTRLIYREHPVTYRLPSAPP